MKSVTNLFQGKPASLEEGPAKYRPINEYLVLHQDESRTNCSKFVQIVKVILCIELIILIGWLGYVSFSYYNTDRNTDCGFAIRCNSSKIVYDNIDVGHSRNGRSIEATEDGQEKCERNANAARRALDSLAAQFVTGESSDPIVFQLRQNFTELTIYTSMHTATGLVVLAEMFMFDTSDTSFIMTLPKEEWHILVKILTERFVNVTESQNRQRLKFRDRPTEEMANEFRDITASLYIDMRECDRRFTDSFPSGRKYNETDEGAHRWKRELEPVNQLTIDCHEAEAQLLEERRERLETYAADVANDHNMMLSTRRFLKLIESALNATSPSEVTVDDKWLYDESGLKQWKRFVSNASLELKKEFYELVRDEYLEIRSANHVSPAWEGSHYNTYKTYRKWMKGLRILLESESPQVALDLTIKYAKVFNLHYVEAERQDSSGDLEAPAFGTITYLDSEPEALGLRRLRNIMNGFVRLYFRVINRLGPCGPAADETPTRDRRSVNNQYGTGDPIQKLSTAPCWNEEEDRVLPEERRERLETFFNKKVKDDKHDQFTEDYLESLAVALNATSTTEINFDEVFLYSTPVLRFMNYLLTNSSLELHREGYEIIRDIYLEMLEIRAHSSEWDGYHEQNTNPNIGDLGIRDNAEVNSESIFNAFIKFGIPFNLRYQELVKRDSGGEPEKPVLGKFTYNGEEPEKLGVRRLRHILDGFVKLYFKIQDPSTPMVCNSTVQPSAEGAEGAKPTKDQRSIGKRSVTADPVPKSITPKCWSEEQDKILTEERRERLAAYAFRLKRKEADVSYRKAFLRDIEAALNATSISEIHFEHDSRKWPWLTYVASLSENSSLEIRKEGYALIRDLYLQLYGLKNHHPEWNGYNLNRIVDNLTASNFFSLDFTKAALFNDIVKYSNVFNLRYEGIGNRESGEEPNKPMFGKFTYVGEEPEKIGIRQLRHILDALVKFYFKTQDPSSVCKRETPTTGPVLETTNPKCWNTEQGPTLLEERRERLEAYAIWNEGDDKYDLFMKKYLDAIGKALNATSASEIYSNNFLLSLMPELTFIKNSTMNSSLELYKETLEISRDLKLAFNELKEHTSKWEGLDIETILNNITESIKAVRYKTGDSGDNSGCITPEIISNNYNALGRPFNLRYEEVENGDGSDKTDTPGLGKFIYLGEEPEKLGVRHFRHILNGAARLYFKVRYPSIAPVCNSSPEGGRNTHTGLAL